MTVFYTKKSSSPPQVSQSKKGKHQEHKTQLLFAFIRLQDSATIQSRSPFFLHKTIPKSLIKELKYTHNFIPAILKVYMERLKSHSFVWFSCVTVAFGLVSFALCLAAEFKKSKKEDLRLEGKLCYLPRSTAFELGAVGLIFLIVTQVTANLLLICRKFCSTEDVTGCKLRMPTLSCALLILSWISFAIAVILISAATSMSRSQQLGQGWLDGQCYLVKDGVYLGSAMLVLAALGSTLGSATIVVRRRQVEENRKEDDQI